jgi:SEC-C motif-containing protein
MRSRYSAYVLGKVDYIIETTHPRNPNFNTDTGAWKEEITLFCKNTIFHKLEILKTEKVGFDGYVTFRATISQEDKDLSFVEESRFRKEDGLWLYREGVFKES